MNLLFSCIGKRGYIADYFRSRLEPGDRILGTGNTPWTPGFAACDAAFLLPDIDSEGYVEAVLDLCRDQEVGGLLSFNDADVYKLAQSAGLFSELGVTLFIPRAESADIAFDKFRTYEFLRDQDIPTPRTVLDPAQAEELGFPVVVKPRRGSGSRNTFIARSGGQLEVFATTEEDMIFQEYVKGEEFDIELCGDLQGETVGFSAWNKYQSRMGETERAETFREEVVFDLGMRLGRLMKVPGPMDIDLIRRDGVIHVLEFNPRFGGGYPVSHLAGADFPGLLMEILRTGSARPRFDYKAGVMMMKRLEPFGGTEDDVRRQMLKVSAG
jgi:carbamoyl-phosphate synthase large subunit